MFISEILETIGEGEGETEICATAETRYDWVAQNVSVGLACFARCVCASGNREHHTPPWLPAAEQVIEHVAHEEADAFAKDVFQSWVRRVRATIPQALP